MIDNLKLLGVFIFYVLLIFGFAAVGFYLVPKVITIMSEIGGLIGAVIGLAVSIALWLFFGKKFVGAE